jgi:hypothetical protein
MKACGMYVLGEQTGYQPHPLLCALSAGAVPAYPLRQPGVYGGLKERT